METMPALTEADIRQRTTERSWARADGYLESVHDVVWRDGELTAQVDGSDYAPYRVHIVYADQTIVSAACSCPYTFGGDCKHIVAVLLYMQRQAHDIAQRPALEDLLHRCDRDQLVAVLLALAARHPDWVDEIDALASRSAHGEGEAGAQTDKGEPASAPMPPVDPTLLRRQIMGDMRGAINTGYDSWGEEAWYDSDLSAALEPALARAWASLEADDASTALAILQAAIEAWNDGADALDEYVYEYFAEMASEFLDELGACWTEAILRTDLDEERRAWWIEYLNEQSEAAFGGEALTMAATAAEQGWAYPPLVAGMAGNITEKGAWEDESPYFADELVAIRLRILDQRGDYQAYLNLAQAEGQFMAYLHMLVRQQQSELAVQEAMAYLNHADDIQALAQTLHEHGETEKAFALAQHGLTQMSDAAPGSRDHSNRGALAAWLRDAAAANGQSELALRAAQEAVALATTLGNYRALQTVAGADWPALKADVLRTVAQQGDRYGQVAIYLHEGMHDEAIAAVDAATWFHNIDMVIDAVRDTHPDWAFRQCCRPAEAIMDAARSKDYDVAASWLRRGRDILLAAGQDDKWRAYLRQIMEAHARKYKLMPLLKALR